MRGTWGITSRNSGVTGCSTLGSSRVGSGHFETIVPQRVDPWESRWTGIGLARISTIPWEVGWWWPVIVEIHVIGLDDDEIDSGRLVDLADCHCSDEDGGLRQLHGVKWKKMRMITYYDTTSTAVVQRLKEQQQRCCKLFFPLWNEQPFTSQCLVVVTWEQCSMFENNVREDADKKW